MAPVSAYLLRTGYFDVSAASSVLRTNPKDPCTYIVYAWALKLLYRNAFKAQVYTIYIHRSSGYAVRVTQEYLTSDGRLSKKREKLQRGGETDGSWGFKGFRV